MNNYKLYKILFNGKDTGMTTPSLDEKLVRLKINIDTKNHPERQGHDDEYEVQLDQVKITYLTTTPKCIILLL